MASPLTDRQFTRLLDDRLDEVFFMHHGADLDENIETLFNVQTSDKAWEELFGMGDIPDYSEFLGTISYSAVFPGYHTKVEHKEFANGIQVTRKLLDDDRYDVIEGMAGRLGESARRTKEKYGCRPWAYAFSTAYDFMTSEEGVALCSNSHTTKASGVSTTTGFDNYATTAFSPAAVEAARIAGNKFRSDIGERLDMNFDTIIVPDELAEDAWELISSAGKVDTDNNNRNWHQGKYRLLIYKRLSDYDANNWFMVDYNKMKNQLYWFNRIATEFGNTQDFDTFIRKYRGYFRISYGWKDWRWVYGHEVS
jgi:hypothetical protein